ncbi:carbohydrate ABC transporter permease [Planotetraspora kaengkrachanensis]|uniref:Sugar ABC transporter permease n=1 Tax=Planotetraspora kaengkrachanensis TaxID=575193 RepID=A0A8J3M463_9ACTN|nr:sugar ABC transporter permease [Planotetraspora kaengkrachanensis]GIG79104.1 sugar ABC transporter permease [Planotetraspora kaengkrachanensis]
MTSITSQKTGARRPSHAPLPDGSRKRGGRPWGLPWIMPAFVFVVGLLYYCIIETGYLSTLDWDGTSPTPTSVGLGNYSEILQDPIFWKAIWHTVVFFVVTFTVQTAIGFVFAALLHSKVKLGAVYKVLVFTPVVLAPATMAPVFRQMFAADGQLNWALDHIGLGFLAQPWLAQSSTAMPVIMFITVWQFTGLTFVLYFAAMGQIDPETLEAARTDGASNLRVLVSIVWPGVRGTTVALAMLGVIGALKTFDVPYLVTIGGPNYSTEFLGTYIYRISIPSAHVGYGAALSILLLILALIGAIAVAARANRKDGESSV